MHSHKNFQDVLHQLQVFSWIVQVLLLLHLVTGKQWRRHQSVEWCCPIPNAVWSTAPTFKTTDERKTVSRQLPSSLGSVFLWCLRFLLRFFAVVCFYWEILIQVLWFVAKWLDGAFVCVDPPKDTEGIEVSHYILQLDSDSGMYRWLYLYMYCLFSVKV